MPLTGKAKQEWRAKNRLKISAYGHRWRQENKERIVASRKKENAKKRARIESSSDFIAKQMFKDRMRTDTAFASEVKHRNKLSRACPLSERAKSRANVRHRLASGWTTNDLHRICKEINGNRRNSLLCKWKEKAKVIARGLQFRARFAKAKGEPKEKKVQGSWDVAIKRSIAAITKATYVTDEWSLRAARIAVSIRKRAMVTNGKQGN